MTVDVSLPEEFLKYFSESLTVLQTENRIILAIDLYLQQKVSLSKAAELSGIGYPKFLEELRDRKIKRDPGYQSSEELEDEFNTLMKLK